MEKKKSGYLILFQLIAILFIGLGLGIRIAIDFNLKSNWPSLGLMLVGGVISLISLKFGNRKEK